MDSRTLLQYFFESLQVVAEPQPDGSFQLWFDDEIELRFELESPRYLLISTKLGPLTEHDSDLIDELATRLHENLALLNQSQALLALDPRQHDWCLFVRLDAREIDLEQCSSRIEGLLNERDRRLRKASRFSGCLPGTGMILA